MRDEINCDIYHVGEAIDKMQEDDGIDRVHVWDSDCVMRGISREEMKERNITDRSESVCYLKGEVMHNFKFKFHQNQIDDYREFCFRPPEVNEADAGQYHTPVESLGENLKEVVLQLQEKYSDVIWDLSKIDGASYAQAGHITDFEFEFDIVCIQ